MKTKKIRAIIKNERGDICHRIKDVLQMALGRNEHISDTKKYIIQNYKDYTVEFEIN